MASIEFDDGCQLGARERDHCKLARPSAKPIIRKQDERRRGEGRGQAAASVRWRGGQLVWSVGS